MMGLSNRSISPIAAVRQASNRRHQNNLEAKEKVIPEKDRRGDNIALEIRVHETDY